MMPNADEKDLPRTHGNMSAQPLRPSTQLWTKGTASVAHVQPTIRTRETHGGPALPIIRAAERLGRWMERHDAVLLAAFSAVYFLIVSLAAIWKPFWYDELLTLQLAKMPSAQRIIQAMRSGFDMQPPPYMLTVWASAQVFGTTSWALRLPSIIGVWLCAAGLYWFLKPRVGAICASAPGAVMLLTLALDYSVEARPYGLLLGATAVALWCWSWVARTPGIWPAVLFACVVTAVSSLHYYAILVIAALILGECVRTLRRRAIEWRIWAGLLLACMTSLTFYLLFGRNAIEGYVPWNPPKLYVLLITYKELLTPVALSAVGFIVLIGSLWRYGNQAEATDSGPIFTVEEAVAITALGLLPVGGHFLAQISGAYTPRYVLPAMIPFFIAFAVALYKVGHKRSVLTVVSVLLMLASGLWSMAWFSWYQYHQRDVYQGIMQPLRNTDRRLAIAIADPKLFFDLWNFADQDLRARLWYLTDPASAVRYTGTNVNDVGYARMLPVVKVNTERVEAFLATHESFYVLSTNDPYEWLVSKLADSGIPVKVLRKRGSSLLLQVVPADAPHVPK